MKLRKETSVGGIKMYRDIEYGVVPVGMARSKWHYSYWYRFPSKEPVISDPVATEADILESVCLDNLKDFYEDENRHTPAARKLELQKILHELTNPLIADLPLTNMLDYEYSDA